MVSSKRLALVLVMTAVVIEKNTMLLFANAEISPPTQCIQYTNVTENLHTEFGIIETFLNSSLLCTQKQPKNGWYRFKYRLNAPFSSNHIDGHSKFLGAPENISCSRQEVTELPCVVHETITSKLCFEVSRNVRIGRSVNITNCGSFYVYQLFQFTCKKDTLTLQRWIGKPRDNNCSMRPTENARQKTDIKAGHVVCDAGWKSSGKSCYQISSEKLSWSYARRACQSQGAHLLKIDDQDEQNYFNGVLQNMSSRLWIGLHAPTNARNWQWESDNSSAIYTNWGHNQPNNDGDNEDCVQIYTGENAGVWHDYRCWYTREYICEKKDNFPSTTQKLSSSTIPNTTVKMSFTTPTSHHNTTRKPRPTIRLSKITPTFHHTTTRKTTVTLSKTTTPTLLHTTTAGKAVNEFAQVEKEMDELERNNNISAEKAQEIIEKLSNLTDLDKMNEKERKNGIKPQSINDTVRILKKIVKLNITAGSVNILAPANNILDGRNKQSWQNLMNNTIINDLITTLENFMFKYADYLKNNPNTSSNFTYENLQVHVKYIKQAGNVSIEERTFMLPNSSFNLSSDALSKTSGTKVAVMWYKTIYLFVSNSFNGRPAIYGKHNSKIITASVRPTPEPKFEEPVRITWNIMETDHPKKCVYWKPKQSENKWKTDGCRRIEDKSSNYRLTCECDHLTAFAVIDISRNLVDGREKQALELISTIGCSMSLVGIFLTILTFALLWKRLHQNTKSSLPSQVLMHLCVAIGMTDIFAILAGPARNNETYCTAVSILLYFFILAVFGWMLCKGIVIYFQLVNVYSGLGLGGKHLKYFYLIGWGIPVVIVPVLVGANDRSDFITERACWCGGGGAIFWTFVVTISLILLINIVIFILALRNVLSSRHVAATSKLNTLEGSTTATKASVDEILRKVKVGLRVSAVLIPLLGLTWLFGLLVFNEDTIVFKYLFAICNSLQGVMIFVFHVLFNRKVHEAMRKERKARLEARNYGKVMESNNDSSPLPTTESSPGKSSIPRSPARTRKSIKNTIFKKGRNNGNRSKGDNEEYIELAKV